MLAWALLDTAPGRLMGAAFVFTLILNLKIARGTHGTRVARLGLALALTRWVAAAIWPWSMDWRLPVIAGMAAYPIQLGGAVLLFTPAASRWFRPGR